MAGTSDPSIHTSKSVSRRGFQGETVVIIGGSSGIGRAVARLAARRGAHVAVIARGQDRLHATVAEIRASGGQADAYVADVSDPGQVRAAARALAERGCEVGAVVYGAGVLHLSPAEQLDIELAKQAMDVNYWGAVVAAQAFLPLLRQGRRKSLVFISSLAVPCTPPFFAAYAAPKHALRGFVLSLRQELRPEGVHVGLVSPGPVDTPLIEGKLNGELYRLPPGMPVLQPEATARGVIRAILRRKTEVVLPGRLRMLVPLAYAFPGLIERFYTLSIPGWQRHLREVNARMREEVRIDEENVGGTGR